MTTRGNVPENYSYEDRGCDVSPKCTACPLPACKYELSNYEQMAAATKQRYERIVETQKANPDMSLDELATQLGISKRTLLRAAREMRP